MLTVQHYKVQQIINQEVAKMERYCPCFFLKDLKQEGAIAATPKITRERGHASSIYCKVEMRRCPLGLPKFIQLPPFDTYEYDERISTNT
ncbi:MAG: hypothetical protein ACREPR_21745 [Brasilonema sp.]